LQVLALATTNGGPPAQLQVSLAAAPVLTPDCWRALHEFARHALALSRAAAATRIELRLAGDATGVRLEVADERAPGDVPPESTTVTRRLLAYYADLAGGRYTLGPRPVPGTLAALHVPTAPSQAPAIS
jgi:signal transduction histidine kinase